MSIQDKKRRKKKHATTLRLEAEQMGVIPASSGVYKGGIADTPAPPMTPGYAKQQDFFFDAPAALLPPSLDDHLRVHYDRAYARWPTRPNTDQPVVWLP